MDRADGRAQRALCIGPLSKERSTELARTLLDTGESGAETAVAAAIADKADGSPFLVEQLARYVSRESSPATTGVSLADMLEARIASMPAAARKLMDTLSVAGRPMHTDLLAQAAGVGIEIEEAALPLREEVKGFCEILGLSPLYLANEGKLVLVLPENQAEAALAAMCSHPAGRQAARIGRVMKDPEGAVVMKTLFGGARVVDLLVGDQLPRIC